MKTDLLMLCFLCFLSGCTATKHDAGSPTNVGRTFEAPSQQVQPPAATPQPRTIKVTVGGWVKTSGTYVLPEGSNIVAALDAAGGFKDDSHQNVLRVIRKVDGQERRIYVRLHYQTGQPKGEFQLLDGDKVYARDQLW